MNKNQKVTRGILLLLVAAFLYSLLPLWIRIAGGGGLPPLSQVLLRYIFAFWCAYVYFALFTKAKITIKKKDIPLLLSANILGYTLTNLFFTYGILYTQVSNVLFLFYSYAIITPVLGFFFLKDKINKFTILALILSGAALYLLFQPNAIPTWKIGGIFAIMSALAQALYLILRKKLQSYSASDMMLTNTFSGVVFVGALTWIFEYQFLVGDGISSITLGVWLSTVIAGINNFLAWFVMTKGFEYFQATSASIILLSELLFGIVFAFLFFAEVPTLITFVGGFVLLCSIIVIILKGEN